MFYPSILSVNHICGTVFKLLYINICNDSPYFRCHDEELFYSFEIMAFKNPETLFIRVVIFAFNKDVAHIMMTLDIAINS